MSERLLTVSGLVATNIQKSRCPLAVSASNPGCHMGRGGHFITGPTVVGDRIVGAGPENYCG